MNRACDVCHEDYDAKRPSSKFCSAKCRNRHQRGATAIVVDLPAEPVVAQSTTARVTAELARVDRLGTYLGAAAVKLAQRIDESTAVMGFAALVKQLMSTMDAALAGTQRREADGLDELKAKRDRKLAG